MSDRWIAGAAGTAHGILLPGRPRGRAADLLLAPEGATVSGGGESALLPWGRHRFDDSWRDDQASSWTVSAYVYFRAPLGVGLAVKGEAVAATAAVRRATQSWRSYAFGPFREGTAVPLDPLDAHDTMGQYWTVAVLCSVLSDRPEARTRLGEPARARRLGIALAADQSKPRIEKTGVRRSAVEVLSAMRSLGYVHRYRGRPVPGDPLPDRDVAIARVQEHLARSPYARGVRIDAEIVASLMVSEYLEVPPWPFQALFD